MAERIVNKLQLLLKVCGYIRNRGDLSVALNDITCALKEELAADYCVIALYDKLSDEIYYRTGCSADCGPGSPRDEDFFRAKIGAGLIGWCASHKKIVNLANARKDKRFSPEIDARTIKELHSLLAVPMISSGELIGVLALFNKNCADHFSKNDENILLISSSLLAPLIHNQRLAEETINRERLSHLGESIANSAHGLKNILNNMDGGAYIVERGVTKKNMIMVDKGWDIIKRNSQRMRDMVLDMLLFSRPRNPEYKPTDINMICRDLDELLQENASQKNVVIKLELDQHIGDVCIDPRGIHRCLLNLVSNAISACSLKSGGRVCIKSRLKDEKTFQLLVEDNGCGISKENMSHIFDVFFSTKGSKGTGLGLPVTRKIISEHQGNIEVDSQAGAGTTFTISLPRYHARGCPDQ